MLLHLHLSYPCQHNIYIYFEVHQRCNRKCKIICYVPCRLQGAAFIQNIFLFYICTGEKILLLRMKDLVFDINWNKYNNLWLTILNLFTRNLCLQFQEMFDWCWELEHQNLHEILDLTEYYQLLFKVLYLGTVIALGFCFIFASIPKL